MMSGFESGQEKQSIDQAVADAMGGISIDDLLSQVSRRSVEGAAATEDPARPTRGGRPGAGGIPDADSGSRIRRGIVAVIRDGDVLIDLGGKSQGVVPLEQFRPSNPDEAETPLSVGQEFEFLYAGYNAREGLVLLARKGAVNQGGWDQLREGDVVEGVVTGANKGGLEVKINNIRAFMPAGQVDVRFTADFNTLVGEKIKCRIMQIDRAERNLVVSRRSVLEDQIAVLREKTWTELATGQIREGVVSSVQPYGAFVDLGGVEGLLHVSAMSHTRVADPGKVVKTGDRVQVMVLQVDREKQRVSLGLKQLQKDPWETAAIDFPIGSVVNGRVTKVMDFGAFVEIGPGVEGLVHVSELSNRRVGHPREVVKADEQVQAKVLAIDTEKKRISLSIAQILREAAAAAKSAELAASPVPPVNETAVPAAPLPTAAKVVPAKKRLLKGGL